MTSNIISDMNVDMTVGMTADRTVVIFMAIKYLGKMYGVDLPIINLKHYVYDACDIDHHI